MGEDVAMNKCIKKIIVIAAAFIIAFTCMPAMAGGLDVHAASVPGRVSNLAATATGQSSVKLTWSRVSKGVTGYAVYRDGRLIRNTGRWGTTFNDSGLRAGTQYSYTVKAFKKYTQKQWYNKRTGKWQNNKPPRKDRGKSRKLTKYSYGKASPSRSVTTKSRSGRR